MGAIANTIAIVVIVCVGYLIIKKVYPTGSLDDCRPSAVVLHRTA